MLQVDLGDYFMPLGPGADKANELLRESLDYLPVSVMNLGTEDFFAWPELAKARIGTKIISTNLVPKSPSTPAPAPYAVLEIPAAKLGTKKNLRIGFIGLTNPSTIRPNSIFTASDPVQAVVKVKPEIMKKADLLFVLADLPKPIAIKIAQDNPQVYGIMLIERAFIEHTPEQVNNAVLVWSVERARYLGKLIIELDEAGNITTFKPQKVVLDASIPDDPLMLKRQNEVRAVVPAESH